MAVETIQGRLVSSGASDYRPDDTLLAIEALTDAPPRHANKRLPTLGWYLVDERPETAAVVGTRRLSMIYRLQSGQLPKDLRRPSQRNAWTSLEGRTIEIKASVSPWHNGWGAYVSRVRFIRLVDDPTGTPSA